MEIRCGSCNKLFRISDGKIAGKGIKFACTRCGDYVRVTQEDLDRYTLSLSAVSVLDTFEPKPKTQAPAPEAEKAETSGPKIAVPDTALPGPESTAPRTDAPLDATRPEPAIPDFLQEREEPAEFESSPFIELPQEPAQDPARSEPENPFFREPPKAPEGTRAQHAEPERPQTADIFEDTSRRKNPEPEMPVKAEAPRPAQELKEAPAAEMRVQAEPERKQELRADAEREKKPAPEMEPKTEPSAHVRPVPPPQAKPRQATSAPAQAQKRPPAKPAAGTPQRAVVSAAPAAKPRSGNMTMVVVIAGLLLGLIGFGAYTLLQPQQKSASTQMTSIAGLSIENASGTPEPNGDLLISGTVVNATDLHKDAWLVVVDVFDANGGVMKKIRLFKGKQLYTKSDYEILQKRGVNIQEVKNKLLSNQGAVIPPKDRVQFELRYLQPPVGIASFNATLQSYDPIRLEKDIAADAQ